jgi:hypothetical protein
VLQLQPPHLVIQLVRSTCAQGVRLLPYIARQTATTQCVDGMCDMYMHACGCRSCRAPSPLDMEEFLLPSLCVWNSDPAEHVCDHLCVYRSGRVPSPSDMEMPTANVLEELAAMGVDTNPFSSKGGKKQLIWNEVGHQEGSVRGSGRGGGGGGEGVWLRRERSRHAAGYCRMLAANPVRPSQSSCSCLLLAAADIPYCCGCCCCCCCFACCSLD